MDVVMRNLTLERDVIAGTGMVRIRCGLQTMFSTHAECEEAEGLFKSAHSGMPAKLPLVLLIREGVSWTPCVRGIRVYALILKR